MEPSGNERREEGQDSSRKSQYDGWRGSEGFTEDKVTSHKSLSCVTARNSPFWLRTVRNESGNSPLFSTFGEWLGTRLRDTVLFLSLSGVFITSY